MKEQYQKEISQIHVPKEILEKTKQAMKEEEEKSHSKKSGKIVSFSRISVAAAAVLLLIMIPAATSNPGKGATDAGAASEKNVQMHLSEKPEAELQAITKDKNWFEELIDTIKEFFD